MRVPADAVTTGRKTRCADARNGTQERRAIPGGGRDAKERPFEFGDFGTKGGLALA